MVQHINKVELQGIVGSVRPAPVIADGPRLIKFSLATDYVYREKGSDFVIETTWHSLLVLEKIKGELDWLEKGKPIHVTGRLCVVRLMDSYGVERVHTEVVVDDILSIQG